MTGAWPPPPGCITRASVLSAHLSPSLALSPCCRFEGAAQLLPKGQHQENSLAHAAAPGLCAAVRPAAKLVLTKVFLNALSTMKGVIKGTDSLISSCHCDMSLHKIIAGVPWNSKCNILSVTPDYNKHLIDYSYYRIPLLCWESLGHRVCHTGLLYLCSWELETYNLKLMAICLHLKSNPVSLCLAKNMIRGISNGSNITVRACQILVAPSTGP